MPTTLLSDAMIIDGTGDKPFTGSILIENEKIRSIHPMGQPTPPADHTVSVEGKAVAPGFIDMHSHADWILPLDGHAEILRALPEQGVTTVVAGNCGFSPAPATPQSRKHLGSLSSITAREPLDYQWRSMGEFLQSVQRKKPLVNLAQLAGHASIRFASGATRRGAFDSDHLAACERTARETMEEGAVGVSLGLGYDPGMYSSNEELEAFARFAKASDRPLTAHLKAYSWLSPCYPMWTPKRHNLLAIDEILQIARNTGVSLQISHFIIVGRRSWSTTAKALKKVDRARAEGLDVWIDAFPYTAGNTTIHAPMPYWFLKTLPEGYRDAKLRRRLKIELELGFRLVGFIYKDFQVMDAGVEGWENLNGMTIQEIAQEWKIDPFDAFLRLAEESRGGTLMLFHAYSGDERTQRHLEAVLAHPNCLFETDAAMKGSGWPNPSANGTFPKVLGEFARDRKLFSLQEAVYRMTGASADRFRLADRGRILPGLAADLTMFDPKTVNDTPPEGRRPAGRPVGIEKVWINGALAVENGSLRPEVRAGVALGAA